jgi:hypothetical protein
MQTSDIITITFTNMPMLIENVSVSECPCYSEVVMGKFTIQETEKMDLIHQT